MYQNATMKAADSLTMLARGMPLGENACEPHVSRLSRAAYHFSGIGPSLYLQKVFVQLLNNPFFQFNRLGKK